jgi:hypothetical protein
MTTTDTSPANLRRMLARYLARSSNPKPRTLYRYGDRSAAVVEAQNAYMREVMRKRREGTRKRVAKVVSQYAGLSNATADAAR